MRYCVVIALLASCATPTRDRGLVGVIDDFLEVGHFRAEAKVRSEVPGSDVFEASSVGIQADGVFSCAVTGEGGFLHVLVATEKTALVWQADVEAWVDVADAGQSVQNVRALALIVRAALETAKVEGLTARFEGEACRPVAEKLGITMPGMAWGQSRFEVRFGVDGDGRLRTIDTDGLFVHEGDRIVSRAQIKIVEYGGPKLLRPEGIPMDDALKALGLDPSKFR